jgi:DNA polymerase-3 subunit delta'
MTMPLSPIYGHETLRRRLGRAAAEARLPQALLLTGPEGVGKQRLALWLAQTLLCADRAAEPCGRCTECRLVLELAHPDLHWFVPIPRLKAGDTARQVEEARGGLADVLAERRETGRWEPPDGTSGHWLASVRALQRVVAVTPFRSRWKVVVLGDAERLVVQEANLEAANALLKVLEEPPADTVLLLTASEPQAVLPTIRSRTVPVRVVRVADAAMRQFLTREAGAELRGTELARRVVEADGRPGRVQRTPADAAAAARARALLDAAVEGPRAWASLALGQPPWGARGGFADTLDALALALRDRLSDAAAAGNAAALGRTLEALAGVDAVRAAVGVNVNPQLALAELARKLERVA